MFKIPLDVTNESTCNISANSQLAELIREASLILWDEAPMTHKHNLEALHRTLVDITKVDAPFGGKVVVLSRDFRQILPVIVHGTRAEIVKASIKQSFLWEHVEVRRLTKNMRLGATLEDETFRDYTLSVGEGTLNLGEESDMIEVPEDLLLEGNDLEGLINHLYSDMSNIRNNSRK
jgi:hypothetical protein